MSEQKAVPEIPEARDEYRPDKFSLSNSEVRSTGILCGGAITAIANELLRRRVDMAALTAEVTRLREQTDRLVFARTDQSLPIARCLTLLSDGHISIGKALEWLEAYITTGVEQPITDGSGESIWNQVTRLRLQVEALSKPVSDEEWRVFVGVVPIDCDDTVEFIDEMAERKDVDALIAARLTPPTSEKEEGK